MAAEILYTVAEVAKLWRCSTRFIYDEIGRGSLQYVPIGTGRAKIRIPESIADAYWRQRLEANGSTGQVPQLRSVA